MEVEAEVEVESRFFEAGGRSAEPEVEVRCRSPWVEAEVGQQRLAEVVVPVRVSQFASSVLCWSTAYRTNLSSKPCQV